MKLLFAVIMALIAACAAGFLAWEFLNPISIPQEALTLSLIGPRELGLLVISVMVTLAVYTASAAMLIAGSMVLGLASARYRLEEAAASERGEYLTAARWDGAFAGSLIEPLAHQMIARMTAPDDDRLLLGAPFSPQTARTEIRIFHNRLFAVAQVWTSSAALILATVGFALAPLPAETGHKLLQLALAADAITLIALALCRLAIVIAREGLLAVISRIPLLESSAPVRLLPMLAGNGYAAIARFPAEAAAAIRREMEAMGKRLEGAGSHSPAANREMMERLAQSIATEIATSFDKRIVTSLRAAEKLITTTRSVAQELTTRLGSLPERLNEQYATERETLRQMLGDASAAARLALEGGVDAFRQLFAELGARQVEEIARTGEESGRATERLCDIVTNACSRIEEDRQSALAQTVRLVEVIEAYTARLLPAMRRLEASDDRMTRSIGQQDETLARLAVAVSELSGTLEALQTSLGHHTLSRTSPPEPARHRLPQAPSTAEAAESTEARTITADLQSLLDDIDGRSSHE
jgi:hypothetical protein